MIYSKKICRPRLVASQFELMFSAHNECHWASLPGLWQTSVEHYLSSDL